MCEPGWGVLGGLPACTAACIESTPAAHNDDGIGVGAVKLAAVMVGFNEWIGIMMWSVTIRINCARTRWGAGRGGVGFECDDVVVR